MVIVKTFVFPLSNRLEKLSGNLKDFYSIRINYCIRINDPWRIVFKWSDGVEKYSSWRDPFGRVSEPDGHIGTTAKFWLGLQDDYDLEEEKHAIFHELDNIKALQYEL